MGLQIGVGGGPCFGGPPALSALLKSLVSYWEFEEASGTRADVLGTNPLTPSGSPLGNTTGVIGEAVQFIAANSVWMTPPNNFVAGMTDWSFVGWIKITTANQWMPLFDWGPPGSSDYVFWSATNGSSGTAPRLAFKSALTASGLEQDINGPTALPTGTFVHLAIVQKGTTIGWYINAQEQVNAQTAWTLASMSDTSANYFGAFRFGGLFDGALDEAGLWSRALTLQEIITSYNAGSGLQYPFAKSAVSPLYLFASFLDSSTQQIRTYWSTDLVNFNETYCYYDVTDGIGVGAQVRDPTIQQVSGQWLLAHTVGDGAITYFGFATSVDGMRSFANAQKVSVTGAVGSPTNVWVATSFLDTLSGYNDYRAYHIIVNIDSAFYEIHPTAADFSTWSTPVALTNSGSWAASVAGAWMQIDGSTYRLWYDNAGPHYIEYAEASNWAGPYTNVQTGNWAGWGTFEGPCLVAKPSGGWRLFADVIVSDTETGEGYSDAATIAGPWTSPTSVNAISIAGASVAPLNGHVVKIG